LRQCQQIGLHSALEIKVIEEFLGGALVRESRKNLSVPM
jgi:hypothetical protein